MFTRNSGISYLDAGKDDFHDSEGTDLPLKGLTVVHYRIAYAILMPEYTWSMWTACMAKH